MNIQIQKERDDLYNKFIKAINEVQQKSSLKNLLLEKKLSTLADSLEKKEAQLNEVLSASNLDPASLSVVTRKLEVKIFLLFYKIQINFLIIFQEVLDAKNTSVSVLTVISIIKHQKEFVDRYRFFSNEISNFFTSWENSISSIFYITRLDSLIVIMRSEYNIFCGMLSFSI